MDVNLAELCVSKKPIAAQRIEPVYNASRAEIEQCIAIEQCQGWFLESVSCHRRDVDKALIEQLLNHPNCPMEVVAVINHLKPDWAANTVAMAQVQLACMEPDGKREWGYYQLDSRYDAGQLRYKYEVRALPALLHDKMFSRSKEYLTRRFSQEQRQQTDKKYPGFFALNQEMLRRTPKFIIEHYLTDKESAKYIATFMDWADLQAYLADFEPGVLALVAARDDIAEAFSRQQVTSKSATVRKALALNATTPKDILTTLAKDKNKAVAEAALNTLPEAERQQFLQQSGTDATLAGNLEHQHQMRVLLLPLAPATELLHIASSATPLLTCAATLHACADAAVINAAASRDLPLWAKVGIALRTADAELISTLIKSADQHIAIALSDNPNLSVDQVLHLIRQRSDDRVLANLANRFIDEPQMLGVIAGQARIWGPWLKQLMLPGTPGTALRAIYRESKARYLVLSRLIARHPNCPKSLFGHFAYYMADDVALNPGYKVLLDKADKASVPKPFDGWKVDDYLDSGQSYEYLCTWLLRNSSDIALQRKTISATFVNPNLVRPQACTSDTHTVRRFIHPSAQAFSEYEYRMVVELTGVASKKALIEQERLSNGLLQELLQDPDKALFRVAQKLALKRGLVKAAEVKQPEIGNLGNKQARLDLVRSTTCSEILTVLAKDKTVDVRCEAAQRSELDTDSLFALLSEDNSDIVQKAFSNLCRRSLAEVEQQKLQNQLKAQVLNPALDPYLRQSLCRKLTDTKFTDSLFKQHDGIFDSIVVATTSDSDLLDKCLFNVLRGDRSLNLDNFANNPHLSASQAEAIMAAKPQLLSRIFMHINSTEVLLSLLPQAQMLQYDLLKNYGSGLKAQQNFSPEQLALLYAAFEPMFFLQFAYKQLHKLTDEAFTSLLPLVPELINYHDVLKNKQYSPQQIKMLLKYLLGRYKRSDMESFLYAFQLDVDDIQHIIQLKSEDLRLLVAMYQPLTAEQIQQLSEDTSESVSDALLHNKHIAAEQLSLDFLQAKAAGRNKSIAKRAKERLQARVN